MKNKIKGLVLTILFTTYACNLHISSKEIEEATHDKKVQKIDSYEFICNKKIGKGSLGSVFLITLQNHEQQQLALKIVRGASLKHSSRLVETEFKFLNLSKHQASVKAIAKYQNCLFLEYINGKTLKDFYISKVLQPNQPYKNILFALETTLKVLKISEELEDKFGIIHNDFHIENIIVNDNGELKIIDFANASLISDVKKIEDEKRWNLDGILQATLGFMLCKNQNKKTFSINKDDLIPEVNDKLYSLIIQYDKYEAPSKPKSYTQLRDEIESLIDSYKKLSKNDD